MHADEIDIDAAQVRRLVAAQFPRWANLPIERVDSAGTDNAMFRLGSDLAVRMPRIKQVVGQTQMEQRWLPRLAPLLPLAIPEPLAMGNPGEGYPWHWSVYQWLQGENATTALIDDLGAAATALAQFVLALRSVDATDGPQPAPHNAFRGVPLAARDRRTRAAIASLAGTLDVEAATSAWEAALHAAPWEGAPVWIHGDLAPGNLLVQQGRLSAVIDFGCLAVGDPACDLMVAWNFLSAEPREIFRTALDDDASWARGRGWALSMAMIALPYYLKTNPVIVAGSWHTIDAVLADHRRRESA